MKRILIFGMTDNPGGMESCIMNYYRFIDRSKFQFDFYVILKQWHIIMKLKIRWKCFYT